ncbi:MAG: 4Fe-4S binding protein [Methanoregula sp.]|jgi:epoxyqueuosine reductase QueG
MSATLRQQIEKKCAGMDIPLVGFAPADRWEDPAEGPLVPKEFRPRAIFPGTNTVIVIGFPVSFPVVDTAPSIWYHELYRTINTLLDSCGYRISLFLNAAGHPSVWIPRDGYGSIEVLIKNPVAFFSHRHAAYYAGLGNFGVNNMLLTPEYGPRIRFASIFTTAEIAGEPLYEKPLCTRCMKCVSACPAEAIPRTGYPEGRTDKKACALNSRELNRRHISPCGGCIRVCPVGNDRKFYGMDNMRIYCEDTPESLPFKRIRDHVRSYGSE